MAFLSSMDVIGSGLTAQQMRLDVISENITNMNTTRTESGGAYRRKVVVLESVARESNAFGTALTRAWNHQCRLVDSHRYQASGGVKVAAIEEDPSEMPLVYDPTSPDADENGYVEMPNVTLVKEITDAMAASQAFSANATAFNTLKQVVAKGLEI